MFDNCNNLTSLLLPNTLKTISAYSFTSCKSGPQGRLRY
ncbi:hypothetical protein [uncultured Ruminococcus sp.]